MKNFITAISLLSLSFFATKLNAQPQPGGGGPGPCWPPTCIPIDGGIGFLLAAAVAFGAKKLYDKKQ